MEQPGYSLKDAAAYLGISVKTLNKHADLYDIARNADPKDRRQRLIAAPDLSRLAIAMRRGSAPMPLPVQDPPIAQLMAQINELRRDVYDLRAMFHARFGIDPPDVLAGLPATGPTFATIDGVAQAAIGFVRDLPPPSDPHEADIVITLLGEEDLFQLAHSSLRREWHDVLRAATMRGWQIAHLIRQTEHPSRTLKVVGDLIAKFGALGSAYRPLYFAYPDCPAAPSDHVYVPGRVLLELIRSPGKAHATSGVIHRPKLASFRAWHSEIDQWRERGRSVASRPPSILAFNQMITDVDLLRADRYLVMNGLSDLTVPASIHRQRAESLRPGVAGAPQASGRQERYRLAQTISEVRTRREDEFDRLVRRHRFRDIASMSAIREYTRTGRYTPNDYLRTLGCDRLTSEQIVAHLTHLIRRLRDPLHRNYQLGLIGEGDKLPAGLDRTFWLVKQDAAVLIECDAINATGEVEELDLELRERSVVEGFFAYSERLWAELGPNHTDRAWVANWLEQRINEVKSYASG